MIERALDEAFADPEVALVHLRAAEYGCFLFEVRRPTVSLAGGRS